MKTGCPGPPCPLHGGLVVDFSDLYDVSEDIVVSYNDTKASKLLVETTPTRCEETSDSAMH